MGDESLPGRAAACRAERAEREAIADSVGKLLREIAAVRTDIGTPPDPISGSPEGTGIRRALARIGETVETIAEAQARIAADLAAAAAAPSRAAAAVWGKRLAWLVLVITIAWQQAAAFFPGLAPRPANAAPGAVPTASARP